MKKIYSVYDKKAMVFFNPMYVDNAVDATRSFERAINDSNTYLCQYPDDFALYELGSFDEEKGQHNLLSIPCLCHEAVEFYVKIKD